MDHRVIKTRSRIKAGLIKILGKKPLADITVSELCSSAGVSRSTFYVHYGNVQDCFDEITDEIIEEMRNILKNEQFNEYETFTRLYFRTARKHPEVFKEIHLNGIHNSMIIKLTDLNNDFYGRGLFIPKKNENLTMSFIFSGFYGMVEAWIAGGCVESEDELVETMSRFSAFRW